MRKKIIIVTLVTAVLLVGFAVYATNKEDDTSETVQSEQRTKANEEQINNNEKSNEEIFDKTLYSIDQPGSIWWIVNKKRPLPEGYVPPDLITPSVKLRLGAGAEQMQFSKTAESALIDMFEAASKDDITLVFGSGYRSYALQKQFYDGYVAQDGQAAADRYSARPGTSEHQTGLSFDATNMSENCHLEICFVETPEGAWIKNNSYKYGFIVRYPDGKESITGYQYEPWHLRYVGSELATELQKTGQTMEEFFQIN